MDWSVLPSLLIYSKTHISRSRLWDVFIRELFTLNEKRNSGVKRRKGTWRDPRRMERTRSSTGVRYFSVPFSLDLSRAPNERPDSRGRDSFGVPRKVKGSYVLGLICYSSPDPRSSGHEERRNWKTTWLFRRRLEREWLHLTPSGPDWPLTWLWSITFLEVSRRWPLHNKVHC